MKTSADYHALVASVEAYVAKHLDAYINELRAWCLIDSGTGNKQGADLQAQVLAARLRKLDMEVTLIEQEVHGHDVLGIMHGTGNSVAAILGHIDTVYPAGTAAERPLSRENHVIYGPGVCDMKGGILLGIYAIEALSRVLTANFHELRFLCVSDEEVGQRHSTSIIQDICRDCQEVFVLEAARANGDVVSARKGTAWYKLSTRGKEAHAGVDAENGRNAILELSHQILQFHRLQGWRTGLTINPGVILGGTSPNVVPAHASVGIDLRFLSATDRIETETRWHEMLTHQYIPEIEATLDLEGFCDPVLCTPASMKMVSQAQEIAATLGFQLDHTMTGGASDARFPSMLGIPVLDGLGPIGGCDHSANEYILEDSVALRAALLAGLLITLNER